MGYMTKWWHCITKWRSFVTFTVHYFTDFILSSVRNITNIWTLEMHICFLIAPFLCKVSFSCPSAINWPLQHICVLICCSWPEFNRRIIVIIISFILYNKYLFHFSFSQLENQEFIFSHVTNNQLGKTTTTRGGVNAPPYTHTHTHG